MFKFGTGSELCTTKLKTEPFYKYIKENYPISNKEIREGKLREDVIFLYGFDKEETNRIQRRVGVMANKGYKCDFHLAFWERTVEDTESIGINRATTYKRFRHGNCLGA